MVTVCVNKQPAAGSGPTPNWVLECLTQYEDENPGDNIKAQPSRTKTVAGLEVASEQALLADELIPIGQVEIDTSSVSMDDLKVQSNDTLRVNLMMSRHQSYSFHFLSDLTLYLNVSAFAR